VSLYIITITISIERQYTPMRLAYEQQQSTDVKKDSLLEALLNFLIN